MIEARDLVKEYRTTERREGLRGAVVDLVAPRRRVRRAIDGIDFAIAAGETVGYIGANGAGKSTTIKILTGILRATSGTVRVDGLDPLRDRSRYVYRIGVVFGQRTQLWWDIAVIEAFRLLARMYGVPDPELRRRIEEFDEVLDLAPLLHTPVRKLSLGQRMRCDLAASLLHRPRIVFLDEPTIGLDVDVKERVRQFVRRVNREHGTTVMLTTHDLRDVEELCDRVLLIDRGKVLFDGPLRDFRRRYARERRVVLDLARAEDQAAAVAGLEGLPVSVECPSAGRLVLRFDPEAVRPADVVARALQGPPLQDLAVQEADLSDVVRDVYRAQGRA
ncbi:ATP-binding cassette domain-containing protein [Myxococcota bacterium]|nr:ATP-binding cassette domain-containing protein [Myxococcota bacterium]